MKKNTARFSDRVENYVKYRSGYPKEFIDYLYTNAGFSKDSIVADIGSGTGIHLNMKQKSMLVSCEDKYNSKSNH